MQNVKPVAKDYDLHDANVVSSHVLYKIKKSVDGSLKLKSSIAPYGNEDDMKSMLTNDSTVFSPTGLRITEFIASFFGWGLYKADIKTAFQRAGAAIKDVHVKSPRERVSRQLRNCSYS